MAGEYAVSLALSEVTQAVYEIRHVATWEDWLEASKRCINVAYLVAFNISVPAMRRPSRYFGAGLVDLPGGGWMQIKPFSNDAA